MRILKDGSDRRFDKARDSPSVLFKFWTIQGLWVFITLLPTLIQNGERRNVPVGTRDYIGWAVWSVGFLFEVVADMQKSIFKANPLNEGKFISSGLWSVSRHPNYFGEISLWFGIYISCSSVFRGVQYLSVLSPVLVMLLITKLSGIVTIQTERNAGYVFKAFLYLKPKVWLSGVIWPNIRNISRMFQSSSLLSRHRQLGLKISIKRESIAFTSQNHLIGA